MDGLGSNVEDWPCEPLVPFVDGLIARSNLVYVAAETQTGKSLLCLNLVQRLVTGGLLFGRYAVTPVQRVSYLVLEDPERRVKERLLDGFHFASGLHIGDDKMWKWLEDMLSTDRPDVVVLDTYQKATPGLSSFDDEKPTHILHRLADLTRRLGLTIIVIDHLRKTIGRGGRSKPATIDDIKGTGGKAQNADCIILLSRDPKDRTRLHLESRSKDFDVPVQIVLKVAPKGWHHEPKFTILEAASDAPARGRPPTGTTTRS